jgi:hypothetical protein
MADLGTIGIAIEVRGREALRQIESDMSAVDRTAKSAARSFEAFERAGLKTADTFQYMSEAATKRLAQEQRVTQELVKQRGAAEQLARANAQRFQSQIGGNLGLGARGVSAGASGSVYEAELERLRTKYDRVYSASKLYEQQLNEIRRAESLGAISTRRMQQELDTLNNEYQQFSNAAEGAFIANNRFSQHVNEAGRGLNNFGMYAQQVGYQVGDFFVQIQSGTNPMVAFGQQATQLAGLIPGVLGAALGIGISLFTAVGAAIMRTGENTKTFQDSLSSLEGNISSLNENVGSITVENYDRMLEKYGQLNQAIYDNIGNITALNAQLISIAQIDLSGLFSESFGGLLTNRIDEMRIAFNTTNDQARVLLMMMDDVGNARGPDELIQAMTVFRDELIRSAGGIDNLTTRQAEFVLEVSRGIDKAEQARGKLEEMGGAAPDSSWMNPAIGGVDALIARVNRALEKVSTLNMTTGNLDWAKTDLGFTLRGEELLGLPQPKGGTGGGGGAARIKKQTEAVKELTAAEKERQTILQSIEGSLENGFMAMVDGTKSVKDAFRSMARDIIKELYNVLVVQRLVGSFDVAKGTGSGLVGFLGKAFTGQLATGGSMMPGKSYLVGENGPELVIPRHSGTVVNANQTANAAGGSGGVTVQNNISVTGSDAAMVRAEVAKMIPQITNATKAAVIDARLRGGQMKSAFR